MNRDIRNSCGNTRFDDASFAWLVYWDVRFGDRETPGNPPPSSLPVAVKPLVNNQTKKVAKPASIMISSL